MKYYHIKVKHPVMGVPITILDQFCPEQFDIVAFRKGTDGHGSVYTVDMENRLLLKNDNCKIPQLLTYIPGFLCGKPETYINGVDHYYRILIQQKSTLI